MAKATTKTLEGSTQEDWRAHVVEFRYKGRQYNAPIDGNLVLSELSVSEIKDFLNELPGRVSYWKSFQVQVEREIADLEDDFERWLQERYMEVDNYHEKRTEGWKKSKVMLDNAQEYRTRRSSIRDMQDVNKKVSVLVSGYTTQTWTLREIARLTHGEMSNIEIRGKGTLSDF